MKVLLLHPNFPGQFKHLSKELANAGHEVVFLCQTHFGKSINGVHRLTLKGKYGHDELEAQNFNLLERTKALSNQYREGLSKLKKQGWNPDYVISHSGWGCGLFTKEIWPQCKFTSYLEWWFSPQSEFFSYGENDPEIGININSIKKNWERNTLVALELASADKIVSPTQWQKSQLPLTFKNNCDVIFDGIDFDYFKPNLSMKPDKPKLTYGTRGMDPFRGFPSLIRSIPDIISRYDVDIEIAGNSKSFYGNPPEHFKNWKKWANDFLEKRDLNNKVTWKGYMNAKEYLQWLQSSWCHLYFTHPFVTSWSMVEALACGSNLIVSDVAATREFCSGLNGITFVDHRDTKQIVYHTLEKLKSSSRGDCYDRTTELEKYGIKHSMLCWLTMMGLE